MQPLPEVRRPAVLRAMVVVVVVVQTYRTMPTRQHPPVLAAHDGRSVVLATRRRPDIGRTLGALRHGGRDPSYRVGADGAVWRASHTPDGPVTVRVCATGEAEIGATAWGGGADWVLDRLPDLVGESDDPRGFDPCHPVLAALTARLAGWRIARSGLVLDSLVPAVLEQKVTSVEAHRSWHELLRRFGSPAPGPADPELLLPPDSAGWVSLPSWEWHRAGVDSRRAATVVRAARVADRLEARAAAGSEALDRTLRTIPGIGAWTSAEVRQRALGDADAVSVGDYNLPKMVGWALAGERTDDAGMLALLARWPGHRYRVTRLLELAGTRPPRRGPRLPIRDYRRI